MKRTVFSLILAILIAPIAIQIHGQTTPERPKLLRLSHVAYYTKNLDSTLKFFKDYLGYDEMTRINDKNGNLWIVIVKINDDQFLEIMPENDSEAKRLSHFAFETDNVEAMRLYLAAKGYRVPPRTNYDSILGMKSFHTSAPHGHDFEFVEYDTKGAVAQSKGKHLPDTRISDVMSHVALATPNLDEAEAYYHGVLGYNEIWRGGSNGAIQWVYYQLPDGNDCIEYLLYSRPQSAAQITGMNHICLDVDDVTALRESLLKKPLPEGCRGPNNVVIGTNNIRQISLYNIDGIRIEIMENHTVDGLPPTAQTGTPLKFSAEGN
jgi:lactoylglutathione lyase